MVRAFKNPSAVIGILSGLLLYGHALIPRCGSWPFIWPLLGGVAAVVWITRRRAESLSVASMFGIGATVGAVAAGVAIVACAVTLPFILRALGLPTQLFSIATVGVIPA